jgi:undecaprenyl pyrophosphate phosphatase UppP
MEPPLLSIRSFLRFLRERPLLWLGVLVVVFGALVWIARTSSAVPESPFQYRL